MPDKTDRARGAIERLAGRIVRSSEQSGRKLTHDQAMDRARNVARRHDRNRKD